MSDINGGNDELISQFMAFTGSADPEKAASYLEMSGNNVETAVGLYMEHEQGGGDLGGGGGGVASATAAAGRGDDVRAPDATRTMRLMEDDNSMGMMGMMGMPQDPAYQLMNAMMDMDEQMAHSAFAAALPVINPRAALDAAIAGQAQGVTLQDGKENDEEKDSGDDDDDDEDFEVVAHSHEPALRLSDMFAAPNHLMHRAGGFQGARTMAKDTKRWLLVNIQRDAEFASHALNRDVWRDELVENLIREGFIFWQQMDTAPEGRTYTERYQVRDYPHIGIIDPRTGRLLWRKEGWTQQNPMTAESFAEMAMDFCSRNSFDRPPQAPRPLVGAPDAAAAARPAKRPMNEMSEAEQLQAAMRASMEEVTAGVDDDGDAEIIYVNDSDDDGNDEVQVVDSKPQAVENKLPTLNDELQSFAVPDEPVNGSRIQMRMPDGKRAVRAFSASDSVRAIYAFVAQSNDEARGGREFVLMAGYPPHDLLSDIDSTIETAKLKGEAITVRWK